MSDNADSTGDEVVESIVAAFQSGPLTPLGRQITEWMHLANPGQARVVEERLMRMLGEEPSG